MQTALFQAYWRNSHWKELKRGNWTTLKNQYTSMDFCGKIWQRAKFQVLTSHGASETRNKSIVTFKDFPSSNTWEATKTTPQGQRSRIGRKTSSNDYIHNKTIKNHISEYSYESSLKKSSSLSSSPQMMSVKDLLHSARSSSFMYDMLEEISKF